MVSPIGQKSNISLCSIRCAEIRHTATNGKQGYPQTRGTQTPEWHVFGVESDKPVAVGVVGGHCWGIFRNEGKGNDERSLGYTPAIYV